VSSRLRASPEVKWRLNGERERVLALKPSSRLPRGFGEVLGGPAGPSAQKRSVGHTLGENPPRLRVTARHRGMPSPELIHPRNLAMLKRIGAIAHFLRNLEARDGIEACEHLRQRLDHPLAYGNRIGTVFLNDRHGQRVSTGNCHSRSSASRDMLPSRPIQNFVATIVLERGELGAEFRAQRGELLVRVLTDKFADDCDLLLRKRRWLCNKLPTVAGQVPTSPVTFSRPPAVGLAVCICLWPLAVRETIGRAIRLGLDPFVSTRCPKRPVQLPVPAEPATRVCLGLCLPRTQPFHPDRFA
jgi:hypothetical protein